MTIPAAHGLTIQFVLSKACWHAWNHATVPSKGQRPSDLWNDLHLELLLTYPPLPSVYQRRPSIHADAERKILTRIYKIVTESYFWHEFIEPGIIVFTYHFIIHNFLLQHWEEHWRQFIPKPNGTCPWAHYWCHSNINGQFPIHRVTWLQLANQ